MINNYNMIPAWAYGIDEEDDSGRVIKPQNKAPSPINVRYFSMSAYSRLQSEGILSAPTED